MADCVSGACLKGLRAGQPDNSRSRRRLALQHLPLSTCLPLIVFHKAHASLNKRFVDDEKMNTNTHTHTRDFLQAFSFLKLSYGEDYTDVCLACQTISFVSEEPWAGNS